MINKVEIDGSRLIINSTSGEYILDFLDKIWEFNLTSSKDKIVIIIDYMGRYQNRNVFCLDERGKVIWQVQDRDTYREGIAKSDSPFTSICIAEDNKLRGRNWDGHTFEIDLETGKITCTGWTK